MRTLLQIGIVVCLFSLSSCGPKRPQVTATSQLSKYILVTALEAWRNGQANWLSTRKPAIRFVDDDHVAGVQLIDYEFEDESALIQPFRNVEIVLSLKDSQGRTCRKVANYQVGVERSLAVLRSDD